MSVEARDCVENASTTFDTKSVFVDPRGLTALRNTRTGDWTISRPRFIQRDTLNRRQTGTCVHVQSWIQNSEPTVRAGQQAGCCEQGNEHTGSITREEFLDKPIKGDSTPWSQLYVRMWNKKWSKFACRDAAIEDAKISGCPNNNTLGTAETSQCLVYVVLCLFTNRLLTMAASISKYVFVEE